MQTASFDREGLIKNQLYIENRNAASALFVIHMGKADNSIKEVKEA